MSEKLEKLFSNIRADENYEFLDGQDDFISDDEYNRAINDKYTI